MSGIKRDSLLVSDKLNILKSYEKDYYIVKTETQIANDLNIIDSTLRTILKHRKDIDKVPKWVEQNDRRQKGAIMSC